MTARNTNSIKRKLLAHAFSTALGAVVVGLCLVRTIKRFDSLYLAVMILFGGVLISGLLWTRRELRGLAAGETAKKHASQFLWSCTFFSMLSLILGMAVSGFNWISTDFVPRLNVVFWVTLMGLAIYPLRRDAKRLADAAGPSQVAPELKDRGNLGAK